MTTKKNNIMSLSLDPDTQDKLRLHAKQKTNGNVSKLIREMVEKFLVLEDDVIPVILRIPIHLKGDSENLKTWLDTRMTAVHKALSS
jgi:hypothetical protein